MAKLSVWTRTWRAVSNMGGPGRAIALAAPSREEYGGGEQGRREADGTIPMEEGRPGPGQAEAMVW